MQPLLIAKLIVLMTIANGTPILLARLMGNRLSQPIDGGVRFVDGRRLLGPSKPFEDFLFRSL